MIDEPATQTLGGFARMKPPLATQIDQEALWAGIADETIDLVETDHAPHTKAEKESETPPFGVPGLETAALLLFKAHADGRLTTGQIKQLLHDNPKRIFAIPDQDETFVEFELGAQFAIGEHGYRSKSGWSPFEGWPVPARVAKVVLRGQAIDFSA
jgi:carbamoyl-phosphate synthase/aspartate carbamoyltransferase/dihydroorotase